MNELDFFKHPLLESFRNFSNEKIEDTFNYFAKNALKVFNSNVNDNTVLTESSFKEVDGNYVFSMDLDEGATAKNVNIEVEYGIITIKYEYKGDKKESSFKLTETLPSDADLDSIDAVVQDGKLTVTVAKAPEKESTDDDDVNVKIVKK